MQNSRFLLNKSNNMACPILWIIIPCYNEEEVLPVTSNLFLRKMDDLITQKMVHSDSRILFVNDGSSDQTWDIIKSLAEKNDKYIGISQSRNRGHQNAVLAGLMEAKDTCDVTITIDCDGQDDIDVMDQMIQEYLNGCEIVYGVRSNRDTDTWFKRTSAQGFYKLLNKMDVETVYNHADYRLVSARVLQHFANFEEVNIFLRGMFPLVGFKSTSVEYERHERIAGKSHYPLRKMIALAIDGITSLSIKPIAIISWIGFVISILGFFGIIWAIIMALTGRTVTGWASIICIICFLGGGSIDQHWHNWRICRKNIYGDEAAS